MAASYYTPEGVKLDDAESLADFMVEQQRGKFNVIEFAIEVHYDVQTGKVSTHNPNPISIRVTNIFSATAFAAIIEPIEAAIRLHAQSAFLKWLYHLPDETLSAVIHQSGFIDKKGHVNYSAIDKAYSQAVSLGIPSLFRDENDITPVQRAVSDVLLNEELDDIRSRADSERLKEMIASRCAEYAKNNTLNK